VGTASVLVHGLVVVMVRSLTIEVVEQRAPVPSPLPVQLITLPPDADQAVTPASETATSAPGSDATAEAPLSPLQTAGNQKPGPDSLNVSTPGQSPSALPTMRPQPATNFPSFPPTATPFPAPEPGPQSGASNSPGEPSVTPNPRPSLPAIPRPEVRPSPLQPAAPGAIASPQAPQPQPPTIRPFPPEVAPPQAAAPPVEPLPPNSPSSPPVVESPPGITRPTDTPPTVPQPNPALEGPISPAGVEPEEIPDVAGETAQPAPEAGEQGGQLTAQIRPHPMGRDIPDVAPQLRGSNTISVRPLPLGCAVENVSALMATATSSTVQLQILVEADGRISAAYVVPGQGSGSGAVDSLVACLVQDRFSLFPAYAGGAPIKTDAFILETQINF
jgi:hypothetical protein